MVNSKKITAVTLFAAVGAVAFAAEKKPNIVFFLMDDMGYGDPSIMGSTKIETPNIDAIARSGKMLVQHYAGSPVSAPSRSVLMTGLHTGHSPIRGNDEWGERGDVWDMAAIAKDSKFEGQRAMPASTRTLAHDLQQVGYKTACIGKWGLGAPGSDSEPGRMGFDFFYGYNCQRVSHTYYPTHLYRNTEREYINSSMSLGQTLAPAANPLDPASYDRFNQGVYAPELMLDETLKFIAANKDNPFFLWWTTPLPHASLQAPKALVDYYVKKFGDEKPFPGGHYCPVRYPKATYAAMVSYVDQCVGRIIQKLKDDGVYDNTIIVFTSDNGPSSEGGGDSPWFDSARPFRSEFGRGKGFLYEGGIRVPTFVSWPGQIKEGTKSDMVCGFQDWRPTLLDMVGARKLMRAQRIDGISLRPMITGRGKQYVHDYMYWEFPDRGMIAVREGDWKLIVTSVRKNPRCMLFNLKTDNMEMVDQSERYPEIVERLKAIAANSHTEPENINFRMGLPLR